MVLTLECKYHWDSGEVRTVAETQEMTTHQRDLAARLMTLAEESLARGEVAEAERLYREVVHFLELVLVPNHVEIAKTLYRLAYILECQEKTAESLSLVARARGIIRGAVRQTLTPAQIISPTPWASPS